MVIEGGEPGLEGQFGEVDICTGECHIDHGVSVPKYGCGGILGIAVKIRKICGSLGRIGHFGAESSGIGQIFLGQLFSKPGEIDFIVEKINAHQTLVSGIIDHLNNLHPFVIVGAEDVSPVAHIVDNIHALSGLHPGALHHIGYGEERQIGSHGGEILVVGLVAIGDPAGHGQQDEDTKDDGVQAGKESVDGCFFLPFFSVDCNIALFHAMIKALQFYTFRNQGDRSYQKVNGQSDGVTGALIDHILPEMIGSAKDKKQQAAADGQGKAGQQVF